MDQGGDADLTDGLELIPDEGGTCPICGSTGYGCSPGMLGSGGVRIVTLAEQKEKPMHTLKARTYVNADSTKVVPEGSTEAAYLLGGEGDEISDETAARLGLTAADSAGGYADLKVDDLKVLASEKGVELPAGAKKADIVEALEASDAAAAEASGTADVGSPDATADAGAPADA